MQKIKNLHEKLTSRRVNLLQDHYSVDQEEREI